MGLIDDIRKKSPQLRNSGLILKAFGQEDEIEKARHGRYSDNSTNRRLHRVGQEYGKSGKKKEEDKKKPRAMDKETSEVDKGKAIVEKIKSAKSPEQLHQMKKQILSDASDWSDSAKHTLNNAINQRIQELKDKKQYSDEELSNHAKKASEEDLNKTVKNHKDEKVRKAAHKELERRQKEEYPKEKKEKDEEINIEIPTDSYNDPLNILQAELKKIGVKSKNVKEGEAIKLIYKDKRATLYFDDDLTENRELKDLLNQMDLKIIYDGEQEMYKVSKIGK